MTPEERAAAVTRNSTGPINVTRYACNALESDIASAIREAVAARTEEIIALANTPEFNELAKNTGWVLANAIRAKFLPAREADHAKP